MKKIVTVAGLASVLAFGGFFTALQTVEAKSCKKWDLACKAKAAADKAKTAAKKAAKKAKAAADKAKAAVKKAKAAAKKGAKKAKAAAKKAAKKAKAAAKKAAKKAKVAADKAKAAAKKAKAAARKGVKKVKAAAKKAAKKAKAAAKKAADKVKYALFKAYLGQMGRKVKKYKLPKVYLNASQPYYKAPLKKHSFGFSKRQPKNNATTACKKTYYNNKDYVRKLRKGQLPEFDNFSWVLHELGHFEQCYQRNFDEFKYSRLWWGDLKKATLERMLTKKNLKNLHDSMKMEQNAENISNQVLEKLRRKYKIKGGKLIKK